MYTIHVLLPLPFDHGFDYLLPEELQAQRGQAVLVPFGRKELWGVILGEGTGEVPAAKLKPIKLVSDAPALQDTLLKFIRWMADYTLAPQGSILAMVLATKEALLPPKPHTVYALNPELNTTWQQGKSLTLTAPRRAVMQALEAHGALAVDALHTASGSSTQVIRDMVKAGIIVQCQQAVSLSVMHAQNTSNVVQFASPAMRYSPAQQQAIDTLCAQVKVHQYSCTVLDGVTGSGKTEVYIEAIRTALEQGKQALILLPEIVLTSQLVDRFAARLGLMPTLWHSQLTSAQRKKHWRAIAEGRAQVVVGARSALLLPYQKLGVIVVDEEHEPSFKQEDGVAYHGRDMAIARAHHEQIPVLLCSATPAMESWWNIRQKKYQHITLTQRHGSAQMPQVNLLDMRAQKMTAQEFIAPPLRTALAETLSKNRQAMLYLNRRGYAPLTLCRTCGYRFESPNSSVWMVLHKPPHGRPYLQCHHSGAIIPLPKHCPQCNAEESFAACGPGVERVAEEVQQLFPQARLLQMTTDTITTANKAEAALRQIRQGEVDIIIGTQMVAKGHHFPALTLVGVVDADLGLEGTDPRAAERTFQLLQQVAGRAGREQELGEVYIQTYLPEHPVMQALAQGDRDGFITAELERRERGHMPPYSRLAALIISGKDELSVKRYAMELAQTAPQIKDVRVLGPAPAPLYMLRKQYRQRLLIIAGRHITLQPMLKEWLTRCPTPSTLRCKVDIDPYSFV